MSRLKTNLLVSVTLVAFALVGTILSSQHAAAQPPGPADGLAVRIVSPLPVPVSGETSVSGTVSAQQSGEWIVSLDTASANPVTVKPLAPITGGGQSDFLSGGATHDYVSPSIASALVISFSGGSGQLLLYSGDSIVGRFPGRDGNVISLALTRPISFTKAQCSGGQGLECTFGWIGNNP